MAGKYDDMSFKKAFVAARKAQGAGKVFTWKGKRYTTNTKEDEAKKKVTKPKPRPKSGAPKKSIKPKKRPGSGEPPVAKPGELAIKKVTTTFIGKGGNTRPLKIPATVTNKIKKINSDIKKISIGEREAASKRLENTKKKLAELRNKKVDKNPGSKIDEILDSLTKLGLYIKDLKKVGVGASGGVAGVKKLRNKKPTVKFGSGGR
jgi:hypothetical protein